MSLPYDRIASAYVNRGNGASTLNPEASTIFWTSGSITSSVDRLEAQGFVKRAPHPTDRRAALVSLTRAGANKIRPISRAHAQRMAELIAVLTPAQQRELARLMKKLGKHAMGLLPEGRPKASGKRYSTVDLEKPQAWRV